MTEHYDLCFEKLSDIENEIINPPTIQRVINIILKELEE